MKKLDKKNTIRLIAVIVFIAVSILVTFLLIPYIKHLTTEAGREAMKARIDAKGAWGWLAFLLVQILQVIIAIIPGEPIEIVGGMLFGSFGGFALCILGLLIGSIGVFYLVRAVGRPLVLAFVSEEKFEQLKILHNQKRLETLIFILFLIPGTPKDALTYCVPLTNIRPRKFLVLSTIARIPSVISSTIVGGNIGRGNWLFAASVFAATALVGLLGIAFNDKLMKSLKSRGTTK